MASNCRFLIPNPFLQCLIWLKSAENECFWELGEDVGEGKDALNDSYFPG